MSIYLYCSLQPTNRHVTVSAVAIATLTAITKPFSTRFEFHIILQIIFDAALSSFSLVLFLHFCSNFNKLPPFYESFFYLQSTVVSYLTFGSHPRRHIISKQCKVENELLMSYEELNIFWQTRDCIEFIFIIVPLLEPIREDDDAFCHCKSFKSAVLISGKWSREEVEEGRQVSRARPHRRLPKLVSVSFAQVISIWLA